jgi:hypothetical protein
VTPPLLIKQLTPLQQPALLPQALPPPPRASPVKLPVEPVQQAPPPRAPPVKLPVEPVQQAQPVKLPVEPVQQTLPPPPQLRPSQPKASPQAPQQTNLNQYKNPKASDLVKGSDYRNRQYGPLGTGYLIKEPKP